MSSPNSISLPQQGKYFTHLNLLRGIAALMVSLYHFSWFSGLKGQLFPNESWVHIAGTYGVNGVYIFFVISGFVIPWSMYNAGYKLRMSGKFMLKRLIRLEPPYLASIAALILWNSYLAHKWGTTFPVDKTRLLLHLGYLIPFTNGKYEWFNVVYWTLSIEFCYYLLMMLIFPLLNSAKRIGYYPVLLLFLCGPFILNHISFLPLFMPCFLLGFLLFLHFTGRMGIAEMLVWATASAVMNFYYRDPGVIISTLVAFFFIWKIKSNTRIGNGMGNISYSYYLLHGLIGNTWLSFYYDPSAGMIGKTGQVLFAVFISVAGATIFYFMFERMPKKWSHKIRLS